MTITELVKSGMKNIMLGHLSEQNNFPELAYQTVMTSIISRKVDVDKLRLQIADRNKPNKVIEL